MNRYDQIRGIVHAEIAELCERLVAEHGAAEAMKHLRASLEPSSSKHPDGYCPRPTSQPRCACTMGVGCDEAGVCYARANGQPERCPVLNKPAL